MSCQQSFLQEEAAKPGKFRYWSFGKYIKTAPKELKKLFAMAESRPVEKSAAYLDVTVNFLVTIKKVS